MAILVSSHQLHKSFASRSLFDALTFSIESQDRIGLIGPNGAGKSTLLKILAGEVASDGGNLSLQRGLKIGYLSQIPRFSDNSTVHTAIFEGSHDPHDWQEISRAQELMSRLELDGSGSVGPDSAVSQLSGGWQKRVALARELLRQPDLLLLDEPTNHLDVESILWLEDLLARSPFATLTITHDRVFLQKVSNRILELDRRNPGGLVSVNGDYATYLERKAELMAGQESREIKLRNNLRRETEWLRRGAQARQTKQQARIKGAAVLKQEVENLAERNVVATARLDFVGAEKNPKRLIEAKGISKAYDGRVVLPKLDLLITPQSRIGLLGPNGCGKSTLIRLLLKREEPDQGEVFHSEHLQVSYFEQNRDSLDHTLSVYKTICPDGDFVEFGGNYVHGRSYLSRFLFSYEQMELPVGKLSGGEQSRLLLARLMLRKSNLLVLDEPTNDLDMATLDVLEEVLKEFQGAVILVTHDRYFLDQVAKQILAFGFSASGEKEIERFAGLDQWTAWHEQQAGRVNGQSTDRAGQAAGSSAYTPTGSSNSKTAGKAKKLSYKDQRELDGIEEKIKTAEALVAALSAESVSPKVLSNSKLLVEVTQKLANAQLDVDRLYARWAELEPS